MEPVIVSDQPMAISELLAAVDGGHVVIGEATRARIAASRGLVDAALASGDPIYGLTTQVGHGKDTRVPPEELERQQRFLVASHGGAFGPPLARRIIRAAMVARINGMARGGSGASPAAVEALVSMLNAGVHPFLHETGSVGAADISPMAGIAQVAIGAGKAEYRGEILPGGEALRKAGITPLRLEGKDGLALISSNGVSIGHGALVLSRATRTADAADEAAALSIEATRGNPSICSPAAARAKPYPGQIAAAAHMMEVLQGSRLLDAGGTTFGPGRTLLPGGSPGTRRAAGVQGDSLALGRSGTEFRKRQPAGRRRIRDGAQQRQLSSDGAGYCVRRLAGGRGPRGPAERTPHEPLVGRHHGNDETGAAAPTGRTCNHAGDTAPVCRFGMLYCPQALGRAGHPGLDQSGQRHRGPRDGCSVECPKD